MLKKIINLYKKYEEIVNYVLVGAATTFVSLAVKWIMWWTICNPKIENYYNQQLPVDISWIIAVLFAYITNRKFVFKSKNNNIIKEICSFIGARIITLFMEKGLTYVFLTILAFNTDLLVMVQAIIIQFLILVFNYIFSKIFVFKERGQLCKKENI